MCASADRALRRHRRRNLRHLRDRHLRSRSRHHRRGIYRRGFRGLDRITFDSADTFATLAESMLEDAERREGVRGELNDHVTRTYTYDVVLPQVLDFVRRGLAS